jgi:hypothetical protein
MKMSYRLGIIVAVLLQLTACATHKKSSSHHQASGNMFSRETVVLTTKHHYAAKNPNAVVFYTNGKRPDAAYRVIGIVTVYKRSLLGASRDASEVRHMVRTLAASIGGEGLINIKDTDRAFQGHVIVFQKITI